MKHARIVSAALASLVLSLPAQADWQLTGDSSLHFLSTKNTDITEVHEFSDISGHITDSGDARFTIDLSSVETGIPIRNERMQTLLFETMKFGEATVSANIPSPLIESVKSGGMIETELEMTVSLHGLSRPVNATLLISSTAEGQILVSTTAPVLVRAADFGLDTGIEALRQVAGLTSISGTVPVVFNLVLTES